MFVKMEAMLIFQRAVMVGIFTGTVEPPLTVTSDERSPPINGHFHSPRGVFLYILPLINGHLPPPVSGHNNL